MTFFKPLNKLEDNKKTQEILYLINSINNSSYWDIERINKYLALEENNSSILVDKKNNLIGIQISYLKYSLNDQIINSPHMFLRRLVIKEKFYSQGFGKKLFFDFIERSQKNFPNIKYVGWQTRIKNQNALSFFRYFGIKEEGNITFQKETDIIFWDKIERLNQIIIKG